MHDSKPKYTQEQVDRCIDELIKRKCSNYGYEFKDFKRISWQRTESRKQIRWLQQARPVTAEELERAGGGRLDIAKCEYTVGQSENEEITNLLRRIVNPNAKWAS